MALRKDGHSLRAIAGAVGVVHATVRRALATTVPHDTVVLPDRVIGLDGKSRRAQTALSEKPVADEDAVQQGTYWRQRTEKDKRRIYQGLASAKGAVTGLHEHAVRRCHVPALFGS